MPGTLDNGDGIVGEREFVALTEKEHFAEVFREYLQESEHADWPLYSTEEVDAVRKLLIDVGIYYENHPKGPL